MPDIDPTQPKRVEQDDLVVENHPLPDQIEADKYNKGTTAQANRHLGIIFRVLEPPGAY